jgi:hypothetical protein
VSRLLTLAIALQLAACQKPKAFPVVVSALTDDGQPLRGVPITIGQSFVGMTDDTGQLRTRLEGQEGAHVAVEAEVPSGYKRVPSNQALVLRRMTRSEGGMKHMLPVEFTLRFAPLKRRYLVLVHSDVASVPVEAFGIERAVTNSRGMAMFVYEGTPGNELKVRLGTGERPELRPQNPQFSFVLGRKSEAYVVRQVFAVQKPPPKRKPVKKPIHIRRL